MKFKVSERDDYREIGIGDLSDLNLRQAAAVADAIARLIPHEGVDYDIEHDGGSVSIVPLTEKGSFWRDYVGAVSATNPPDISCESDMKMMLSAYLGSIIPRDGVDYDLVMLFGGGNTKSGAYRLVPHNERGRLWIRYVANAIRRYPPTVDYRADVLPDEQPPVETIPEEFKEEVK